MSRCQALVRFYALLDALAERTDGPRVLSSCHGRMRWPRRGLYFFFEPGEVRSDTGVGPRVVRVGTHAVSAGSRSTLWSRLGCHRGTRSGGGNHRASVFRLLVGRAMLRRDGLEMPSWGLAGSRGAAATRLGIARHELEGAEGPVEQAVSRHVGAMPFLWLPVDDEPGPASARAVLERQAIALLSNHGRPTLDPPSKKWIGHWSHSETVRSSGLWNQDHVQRAPDAGFVDELAEWVGRV